MPNYKFSDFNPLENTKFSIINEVIKTYTINTENIFIDFIKDLFNKPISKEDIEKLDKLEYKPSKSFIEHLKDEFKNIKLIASQRSAFEAIKEIIKKANLNNQKNLIFISGSAGSGKTIIAFKILGYIISKILKSVKLMLPGPEFRDAVKKEYKKNTLIEFIGGADIRASNEFIIIDEAHKATGEGTAGSFYKNILKKSNFLICLIDNSQIVNKKGITQKQIEQSAKEQNFYIESFNLEEHFRNGGDSTYTEWLKKWIFNVENGQDEFVQNYFEFKLLNEKIFNEQYTIKYDLFNTRMISFWTQTWDINNLDKKGMPNRNIKIGNKFYAWNPNWQWLQQLKRSNKDIKISPKLKKICEENNFNSTKKGKEYIAYFNTVQGSEFEYIFVHIPKLFFWNKKENKLDVDISQLHMREMKTQIWSLKNIKDKKEYKRKEMLNKLYFKNRLFVNLTRATKGTFVYIEDETLKEKLNNLVR